MAQKQTSSPKKKRDRFLFIKTLANATALLACLAWMIGGIKSGARTSGIIYACAGTVICVVFVCWVVIRIMASYEEINSGQA